MCKIWIDDCIQIRLKIILQASEAFVIRSVVSKSQKDHQWVSITVQLAIDADDELDRKW